MSATASENVCRSCGGALSETVWPHIVFGGTEGMTPSVDGAICQGCRDAKLKEYDESHRCHACSAPYSATIPHQWKVGDENKMHHLISIWLVTRCCGALAHTEQVAFIATYLHDGERNAAKVCELINKATNDTTTEPEGER